ncbi:MAG: ribonuclease III domain-containing protein, partial [Flavobacterium sp.]
MNLFKKIFIKNKPKEIPTELQLKISKKIGFLINNVTIYEKVFIHRSANIIDGNGKILSYERLEFLGDSVLSLVIAQHLFLSAPSEDEGYLTKMRAKIVSRENLNKIGKELNVIEFLQSKIGSQQFGDNIYGNVFEALIGAIFIDKGFDFCKDFIYKNVINNTGNIEKLEGKVISYKSLIIEWCQKHKKSFKFEIFDEETKDVVKHFGVKLYINEELVA